MLSIEPYNHSLPGLQMQLYFSGKSRASRHLTTSDQNTRTGQRLRINQEEDAKFRKGTERESAKDQDQIGTASWSFTWPWSSGT